MKRMTDISTALGLVTSLLAGCHSIGEQQQPFQQQFQQQQQQQFQQQLQRNSNKQMNQLLQTIPKK